MRPSAPACDVLLVEDSFDDAFFMKKAREKLGMDVRLCHVESIAKAKAFLSAEGDFQGREGLPVPSLIVSDLKMPNGDGIELLRWVRSDPKFASIPFVVVSSSALENDVDSSYGAGANAYFVKPRTLPGFVNLLTELQPYWQNGDGKPLTREV